LGLSVLYTPKDEAPTTDIIFIHGIGGTSRLTWSYNRDDTFFWPQAWLPAEPDIGTARILSYGYNACFAAQGPNSIVGISDVAKQLLSHMKFDRSTSGEPINIGQRPIIFVVHSMGGLVLKKAVVQGVHDPEFRELVSQIKAVLFLSTPHRGTKLAGILNRALAVSIFNHSPKRYLTELNHNSPFIEDLNDEFKAHAPNLRIYSFYETLETTIGIKHQMILQTSSSTLGYPGETTFPLNADHHNVCKFPNRDDPSYRLVSGVIRELVSTSQRQKICLDDAQSKAENETLLSFLCHFSDPQDDYNAFLQLWRPGTCQGTVDSP
jgi:hypothetical protein